MPIFLGDRFFASDTLRINTAAAVPSVESPEQVFGAGSYLVDQPLPEAAAAQASPFFSAALVACLVGWCLIVWAYREYALASLGIVRGGVVTEKLLDRRNKLFSIFLNLATVLGFAVLGLAVVHAARPELHDAAAVCIAAAAAAVIWALQWCALRAAGRLTLYDEFTKKLFYVRRIVAAMSAIILTPLFLLWVLSGSKWLGWGLLLVSAGFILLLLTRSLMLFVRQRFSILLWILYLCGVEILPVLTVVIMAGKLFLWK